MKSKQVTKKVDFTGQKFYVGIDVHKKSWTVSIMSEQLEHKYFTQPPDPLVLVSYLKKHFPNAFYLSAYEAGFSGFWIHKALCKQGVNNIVVHPADIPGTDKERKQKRDHLDARKIAKALRSKNLTGIYVMENDLLQDRLLVRTRKKLIKDRTRCKNRIKTILNYFGISIPEEYDKSYWSRKFIKWIEDLDFEGGSSQITMSILLQELLMIDNHIKTLYKQIAELAQAKYQNLNKLLRSIPGIGLLGAITIITEINDINRFKRFDDLCSYVGLIPNVYASGENEYIGRITKRCNNYLQPVLIECAWRAVKKDPALLMAYNEYCLRMKSTKAIVRIARKLLSRVRYVLKNQNEYHMSTVE